MKKIVDVHMGVTRPWLLDRAVASVPEWMELHLIRDAGSVYELRKRGFSLGTCDYVTYLDDDDLFLPGIESAVHVIEQAEANAFFTDSLRVINDRPPHQTLQESSGIFPHNPIFFKRRLAEELCVQAYTYLRGKNEHYQAAMDMIMRYEAWIAGEWRYLPVVGYQWNWTANSASLLHKYQPAMADVHAHYRELMPIDRSIPQLSVI